VGFFKDMSDSAINLFQYRRFADQPWGKVISYLLLIVLILGIPVLLSFVFDFNKGVGGLIAAFIIFFCVLLVSDAISMSASQTILDSESDCSLTYYRQVEL
jgi:hypothetical protein